MTMIYIEQKVLLLDEIEHKQLATPIQFHVDILLRRVGSEVIQPTRGGIRGVDGFLLYYLS